VDTDYDETAKLESLFLEQFDEQVREVGLSKFAPRSGERVLVIGFGTRQSRAAIAQSVGPGGEALGFDLSERGQLGCGDAYLLPYGANSLDGIFTSYPCAIKTLSGIATSFSDNLLLRAADVTLKERRRLVLLVRETPLHLGHLRLLVQAAELGAVVLPPVPAFYHRPATVEEIIDQTVNRALDLLDIEIEQDLFRRWQGPAEQTPRQLTNGKAHHHDRAEARPPA
jgi:hypothetical protein